MQRWGFAPVPAFHEYLCVLVIPDPGSFVFKVPLVGRSAGWSQLVASLGVFERP